MTHPAQPQLRNTDREMIPKTLVRAMFVLAMASLAIVSFAVLTDREHVGQPKPAPIIAERQIILEGHGAKAVIVRAADGSVIADLDHGGFIAVIQNGLQRARGMRGVDQTLPVQLISYENNRLTLLDPETGWSAELGAFGGDNKAAFERLFTN